MDQQEYVVKEIAFICKGNSFKSILAEAIFNHFNTNPEYIAVSGGTKLKERLNPYTLQMLDERGINYQRSELRPKLFEASQEYIDIYSMGCEINCDNDYQKLDIPALSGQGIQRARYITDIIEDKIKKIVEELS